MRALTLWQPWASLVAVGAKQWETRSWGTDYRGPMLIHAAMRKPPEITKPLVVEVMIEALGLADFNELPRGVVLAVVDLADVFRHTPLCSPRFRELLLGDYGPGRHVWVLENIRRLEIPVQATGARGLWRPGPSLLEEVMAEVAR